MGQREWLLNLKIMKRINLTHGTARVDDSCPQKTINALNKLSEAAYNHFERKWTVPPRGKLIRKFPMTTRVLDEFNQIWDYYFFDGKIIFIFLYQAH